MKQMKAFVRFCVAVTGLLPWAAAAGQSTGPVPENSAVIYRIKKCDDPKVPIGEIADASGKVSFLLGKDGKPDTASVAVLEVAGMSVAGYRSVAVRELASCRLEMGKSAPGAPLSAAQEIGFSKGNSQLAPAVPNSDPAPPLTPEPMTISSDSFPILATDRRVDERPRILHCPAWPTTPVIHAAGSSQAQARDDAQRQIQDWNRRNTGSAQFLLLIGTDGKPGHAVKILKESNPMATSTLTEHIGGCQFVPARIRGVLVPILYNVTIVR